MPCYNLKISFVYNYSRSQIFADVSVNVKTAQKGYSLGIAVQKEPNFKVASQP